jgi:hypothetical protein
MLFGDCSELSIFATAEDFLKIQFNGRALAAQSVANLHNVFGNIASAPDKMHCSTSSALQGAMLLRTSPSSQSILLG